MSDVLNASPENLLWVDCETTGLNTRADHLLEVAIVATTRKLDVLGSLSIVLQTDRYSITTMEIAPVVEEMHTKTGLWDECAKSLVTIEEAEQQLLRFCAEYSIERTSPMCGSSVHFDREMLRTWMPTLQAFFHYRNFDTSTLKIAALLGDRIMPEGLQVFPGQPHRALYDVGVSIAEARAFLSML